MLKGRCCTLGPLHVPIRQLCELFYYDEQLFIRQFQHPPSEIDHVVGLLEQHSAQGLVEFFSLFDLEDRFVAHFRIDLFPSDIGLLGFHGGSFVASPALGRVFLEGSLLLLEATLTDYGWTHVLSNCLVKNEATSHFLSGLGFRCGYVARSQRLVGGNPVDVMHFFLTQNEYRANRLRERFIGGQHIAPLRASPATRPADLAMHCLASQESLHPSIMQRCCSVLTEASRAEPGSRLRFIEESAVSHLLGPFLPEILAHWKRYTGIDGHPTGLDDIVASWGSYTSVMLLLPLCVLDDAGVRAIAFFVIRLFSGNPNLAEIAGGGLDNADPATFAPEVRTLLDDLLTSSDLCRIQARTRGGELLWRTHLGFTLEGQDHEGSEVYSLVASDADVM